MPYRLVGVDHGVPVFSLFDIEIFGLPDLWGIEEYLVIDSPEISCPMVMDHKEEIIRKCTIRPIHRYSKDQRFKALIIKFIGGKCISKQNEKIFEKIFEEISIHVCLDKNNIWNSSRGILKRMGYSRFYDDIPLILSTLGYEYRINHDNLDLKELLNDFKKLVAGFESLSIGTRKYMLNFRFIALKLLERHGVIFEYYIPKIQTLRKIEEFETLWTRLEIFLD